MQVIILISLHITLTVIMLYDSIMFIKQNNSKMPSILTEKNYQLYILNIKTAKKIKILIHQINRENDRCTRKK